MCNAHGLNWACGHQWRGFELCQTALATGQLGDECSETSPWPVSSSEDLAVAIERKDEPWYSELHGRFWTLSWCCSSSCCCLRLEEVQQVTDSIVNDRGPRIASKENKDKLRNSYYAYYKRHISDGCFTRLERGLGRNDNMKQDMGDEPVVDRVPDIDPSLLQPDREQEIRDSGELYSFNEMLRKQEHPKLNLEAESRSSIDQYQFIKRYLEMDLESRIVTAPYEIQRRLTQSLIILEQKLKRNSDAGYSDDKFLELHYQLEKIISARQKERWFEDMPWERQRDLCARRHQLGLRLTILLDALRPTIESRMARDIANNDNWMDYPELLDSIGRVVRWLDFMNTEFEIWMNRLTSSQRTIMATTIDRYQPQAEPSQSQASQASILSPAQQDLLLEQQVLIASIPQEQFAQATQTQQTVDHEEEDLYGVSDRDDDDDEQEEEEEDEGEEYWHDVYVYYQRNPVSRPLRPILPGPLPQR